jgi:hypothetical protein
MGEKKRGTGDTIITTVKLKVAPVRKEVRNKRGGGVLKSKGERRAAWTGGRW